MRKSAAKSETKWKRVQQEVAADAPIPYEPADGPYDPNDGETMPRYLESVTVIRRRGQRGPQKSPTKERVSLRLSPEIVKHFRKRGRGWQSRINEVLLKAVKKRG